MKTELSEAKVAVYSNRKIGLVQSLITPFSNAWQYRELIRVIVGRELRQRFRDSYFGWIWAIVAPLVMLAAFLLVFSGPLKIASGPSMNFALSTFIGIILFNAFAELISRAPSLLPEHSHFIKKSIFPSEVLAWTSTLRTLTYAAIGFFVFLVVEIILVGSIPLTLLLFPVILLPFCLLLLGSTWALAALGAFTRDISFMMSAIVPVLIFVTPVFYTTLDYPLSKKLFSYINPMAPYVEMAREILLLGQAPDLLSYSTAWVLSLFIFYAGYTFFMRYRSVVVDVI